MHLCLADLASLVEGTLHFGPLPPVDGPWTTVVRIVLDSRLAQPGDLFWRLPGTPWQTACSTQHALLRGAAGVVTHAVDLAGWPGAFCLEVDDPLVALSRLVAWLEADRPGKKRIERNRPELKDLQLCGPRDAVITPPTRERAGTASLTCSRPTAERFRSRCQRKAA